MAGRAASSEALDAFMMRKASVDALLSRLQARSADHFGVSPDRVDWGCVGDLEDLALLLRDACDKAFHEGEYAR